MAPPGNQAANRENKHPPIVTGETGLLDSIIFKNRKESLACQGGGHVQLFVFGRNLRIGYPYETPNFPVVIRLYDDFWGRPVPLKLEGRP